LPRPCPLPHVLCGTNGLGEVPITGQQDRSVVRVALSQSHEIERDQRVYAFLLALWVERPVLINLREQVWWIDPQPKGSRMQRLLDRILQARLSFSDMTKP
jgi:hypothetical protein